MTDVLSDQVAVITGAGRGIGRAIALKFAKAGAKVVCVSRTAENAGRVAGEIRDQGHKAWSFAVDVADPVAVKQTAKMILDETGKVDILVNNAGVTRDGLLMRMSEEDWDTVMNTNLRGAFSFCKALARGFLKAAIWANHQYCLGHWTGRQCWAVQLCREQGGIDWVYQVRGQGTGLPWCDG